MSSHFVSLYQRIQDIPSRGIYKTSYLVERGEVLQLIQELYQQINAMPENHNNSWMWKKKVLSMLGKDET